MSDSRDVGVSLVQNAFGIHRAAWSGGTFDTTLVEHHFFTEIFELSLSEQELKNHPDAQEFLDSYPLAFIKQKAEGASTSEDYLRRRRIFNALLDEQPESARSEIRNSAIYRMHCALMRQEFGDFWDSFSSDCRGLTKEAEVFIERFEGNAAKVAPRREQPKLSPEEGEFNSSRSRPSKDFIANTTNTNVDVKPADEPPQQTGYIYKDAAVFVVRNSFGISEAAWSSGSFNHEPIEHFFFSELLHATLSNEELSKQPEVRRFIATYPLKFVRAMAAAAANFAGSVTGSQTFYGCLQHHPVDKHVELRRYSMYEIHCALMRRDFGESWDDFCHGITKEAQAFIDIFGKGEAEEEPAGEPLQLTDDESELLNIFRALKPNERTAVLKMLTDLRVSVRR